MGREARSCSGFEDAERRRRPRLRGGDVALQVGDAIRVETTGRGGWRLGNRREEPALLALVQMPPARTGGLPSAAP